MTRRSDVQGIRAIAILMVVAFHAGLAVPGGFAGVDVFFVISGFVIGRLLLAELSESDRLELRRFYGKRVRRLVPALAVALVAVLVGAVLFTAADRTADIVRSAIASATGVSNAYFYLNTGGYFDVPDGQVPLLHTWTLAVEAQFYVVAPLALLLAWKLGRRGGPDGGRHSVLVFSAVLLVVSFVGAALLASGSFTLGGRLSDPQSLAFYGLPTRAWEFLAGIVVAVLEARIAAWNRPRLAVALAALGAAALVVMSAFGDHLGAVPALGVLPAVAGAAALIVTGTAAPDNVIARALSIRPMTWLGDISYSWYLWHWPCIVFAAIAAPERDLAPLLAVVSIVPAWLSYRYVERPGLRISPGPRTTALAVGSVAAVVVAGAAAGAAQDRIAATADIGGLRAALSDPALVEAGACRDAAGGVWTTADAGVANCTPEIDRAAPRLLLAGDSQADAYGYGLREVARRRGMRLDVATRSSCIAAPVQWPTGVQPTGASGCQQLAADVAESIAADPPSLLVVSQARNLRAFVDGDEAVSDEELHRRYRDALRQLVARVRDEGGSVLLLRAVPDFGARDGSSCATGARVIAGSARSCLTSPRQPAEIDARTFPLWRATLENGPTTYDPSSAFCGATMCSQIRGNQLAYRNGNHLSARGSRDLAPILDQAVGKALQP